MLLKRDNYTVDKVVLAQITGRGARRCVGADHRGTDGRLPEARGRRDQDLSAQGRQGAVHARSRRSAKSARPAPTLEALLKEWGITPRARCRHRHQRHGAVARHRRVGAGRRDISAASRSRRTSICSRRFRSRSRCRGEAGVELGTANTQNVHSDRATEAGRNRT